MHIAISITENFIEFAYVMLVSLLENNKDEHITAYILYSEIDDEKLCFGQLEEIYDVDFICQKIDRSVFPDNLPITNYWPLEMYYRFFLVDFVESDRVLYLDVDTIVNKDIRDYYHSDFEENLVMASHDMGIFDDSLDFDKVKSINIKPEEYFNSGVLLMNLNAMREEGLNSDKLISILEEYKLPDQDILNIAFNKRVKWVDEKKYNFYTMQSYKAGRGLEWARDNALILHFAGRKPWTIEALRYETEMIWWEYAKKTPFYWKMVEELVLGTVESPMIYDVLMSALEEKQVLISNISQSQEACKKLLKMLEGGK